MKISELKKAGYYILISIDEIKKQTQYQIVKDISETEKTIACELNRAAFLKAKNEIGFSTKIKPSCFLNFIIAYGHAETGEQDGLTPVLIGDSVTATT